MTVFITEHLNRFYPEI